MGIKLVNLQGEWQEWNAPGPEEKRMEFKWLDNFNYYQKESPNGKPLAATETIDELIRLFRKGEDIDEGLLKIEHDDPSDLFSISSYTPRHELLMTNKPYHRLGVLHKHKFAIRIAPGTTGNNKDFETEARAYIGILAEENHDEIFYLCCKKMGKDEIVKKPGETYNLEPEEILHTLVLLTDTNHVTPEERYHTIHTELIRPLWGHTIRILEMLEPCMQQMKEVERNKWYLSQEAGYDVGGFEAVVDFAKNYAPSYRERINTRLAELRGTPIEVKINGEDSETNTESEGEDRNNEEKV